MNRSKIRAVLISFFLIFGTIQSVKLYAQSTIVIDHNCTDVSQIPDYWVEQAKSMIVQYVGQSHGRQVPHGLELLTSQNPKFNVQIGTNYSLLTDQTALKVLRSQRSQYNSWTEESVDDNLYWSIESGRQMTERTAQYAVDAGKPLTVSLWCWCWDMSNELYVHDESGNDYTFDNERNNAYLNAIARFNTNYPQTKFVYHTGVTDIGNWNNGSGWRANRWNDEIRSRANQMGGILFDQADIENWNVNGTQQNIVNWNDNGTIRQVYIKHGDYDEAVGTKYQPGHTNDALCLQKAKAFWWMLARIAGWDGVTQDSLQLLISNIASSTTTQSAEINWITNLSSTSQVEYGTFAAYGSITDADQTLTTNHSINISGLQPGTVYHYRVISIDGSGSQVMSDDRTFTTQAEIQYYSLTVNSINGSVTKQPDQTQYAAGTQVTLTAVPYADYTFSYWSSDASGSNSTVTITMDGNKTVTANFVSQPPVVVTNPEEGLLAYWKFNEGKGTDVIDYSGNNKTGVIQNADASSCWITGHEGTAVNLDGADDFINFGSDFLSSIPTFKLSVSLWFKTDDVSRQDQVIIRRGRYIAPFSVALEKNTVKLGIRTNIGTNYLYSSPSTKIAAGRWYHLVMTYGDGKLTLYLNGQENASRSSITGTAFGMEYGTNYLLIGRNTNADLTDNQSPFRGAVDAVRIYNKDLSLNEVQNIYNLVPEKETYPSLAGYWKFNEDNGSTVEDFSGNNNTGTLENIDLANCRVQGHDGKAINFDGVDDFINFGTTDFQPETSTNELSISLWFKADDVSRTDQVIFRRGRYIYPFAISLVKNRIKVGVRTNTTVNYLYSLASTPIVAGRWYHAAITFGNNALKLFIDGQLNSSLNPTNGTSLWFGYGTSFSLIGRNSNSDLTLNEYQFVGAVDEVMIFDKALSDSEIENIYEKDPHQGSSTFLIQNVAATTGAQNATITWITNEPSTSQVEYGTTGSYGTKTTVNQTLTVNHSVTISGLIPGTQYHYRVISVDGLNRQAESQDQVFTTQAEIKNYTFTLNAVNGIITKQPDLPQYAEGSRVTIIANPAQGYVFSYWSGDASGTNGSTTITMDGNKNVTANFIQAPAGTNSLIPSITIEPGIDVEVGETVFLNASSTYYSGDVTLLRKAKYEWDFGDGYFINKGFPYYYIQGQGIACIHYFMKPGVYNVKLVVSVYTSFNGDGTPVGSPLAKDSTILTLNISGEEPIAGFELQHAPIHARLAQYIYAQIPVSCQSNATTLKVSLIGPGEMSTILFTKSSLESEEKILFDQKTLPQGDYVLQAELLQADGQRMPGGIWREKFSKKYSGIPKVGFDENNSMLVNGQLFFPMMPFMINTDNMQMFIDSAGVNAFHTEGWYSTHNSSTWSDFLNYAASKGVMCAGPTRGDFGWGEAEPRRQRFNHDIDKMIGYVRSNRDKSALMMWSWEDEPNLGGWHEKVYLPVLAAWQYITHREDPQHPSYDNYTLYDWLKYYKTDPTIYDYLQSHKFLGGKKWISDAIGGDIYPMEYRLHVSLNYSDMGPYAAYVHAIHRVRNNNKDLVPIFPALQICEEDPSGVNSTPPVTGEQVYMEAWMNVIHGAKGILWFPYFNRATRRYSAMKKFAEQMNVLYPVVLGPDVSRTVMSDANIPLKRVDAMVRENNGDIYIFTVRITEPDPIPGSLYGGIEPESITANFVVSDIVGEYEVQVVDENRTITLTNGQFSDTFDKNAVHIYRISSQISLSKKGTANENIPLEFELDQNYPNPFNPVTTIYYQVPGFEKCKHVSLRIFDVIGREVADLVDEEKQSGKYHVQWDGSNMASGVYFYQLRIGNELSTKKMILLR